MPSFKTFLLPIALLVVTSRAATCSGDWLSNTFNGDTKCCYGNMLVDNSDAFCCVYDLTPSVESSSASTTTTTSDECFTKIPFSASDYSDLVSSASSKIAATRATVATNDAKSTSTGASSASSGTSSAASNTSSQTSSGSAASTSNAAMPIATAQEMMLGGAAVVVGLFVL